MRYLLALIPILPSVAHAAPNTFKDLVGIVLNINQYLVYLIFALTFLVLAWTIINTWIIKVGDETAVDNGKKVVTVGIIVLVIMSGIWGILAILRSTLI